MTTTESVLLLLNVLLLLGWSFTIHKNSDLQKQLKHSKEQLGSTYNENLDLEAEISKLQTDLQKTKTKLASTQEELNLQLMGGPNEPWTLG